MQLLHVSTCNIHIHVHNCVHHLHVHINTHYVDITYLATVVQSANVREAIYLSLVSVKLKCTYCTSITCIHTSYTRTLQEPVVHITLISIPIKETADDGKEI